MKALEAHRAAQRAARRALEEGDSTPPPVAAEPDGDNGRDWDDGDQAWQRRQAWLAAKKAERERMQEEPGHWTADLRSTAGVTRIECPVPFLEPPGWKGTGG